MARVDDAPHHCHFDGCTAPAVLQIWRADRTLLACGAHADAAHQTLSPRMRGELPLTDRQRERIGWVAQWAASAAHWARTYSTVARCSAPVPQACLISFGRALGRMERWAHQLPQAYQARAETLSTALERAVLDTPPGAAAPVLAARRSAAAAPPVAR